MTVGSVGDGRPVRVLCLHGTCSCAAAMRKQISRLLTVKRNALELVCVDGPMLAEEDNPQRAEQERFFKGMQFYDFARIAQDGGEDELEASHISADLDKRFPDVMDRCVHLANHPEDRLNCSMPRRYVDVEVALEYLQGQLRAHAPIDGVLGFSQGANFASLLAAQAEAGEGVPFSFVVHLCPARPGWHLQLPELFKRPFAMPSMHVSGERDFVNPPLCLKHLYEEPTCIMHNDGHRPIPGTSSEEANRIARSIVDFILRQPLMDEGPSPVASAHGLARELNVVICVDPDLDLKSNRVVKSGTSVWALKEMIARSISAKPNDFDLRIRGGAILNDKYVLTDDNSELEVCMD